MPRISNRQSRIALTWAAVLVFLVRASPSWNSVVDDAYISARYAAMLATGHGFTYSADAAPLEGVTNLLWTFLLVPATRLGLDIAGFMTGLGAAFGALSVLLVTPLTRKLAQSDAPTVCLPAWVMALSPHLAVASTNGLESSQMLALSLLAILTHLTDTTSSRWQAGLASALLLWVRPEGAVLVGLLGLHALWRDRRAPGRLVRNLAWPTLSLAALFLWRLQTFGMWLPNTYAAKTSFPLSQTWQINGNYLTADAPTLIGGLVCLCVGALLCLRSSEGLLLTALCAALGAIPFTVYLWMPGLRLFLLPLTLALVLCVVGAHALSGYARTAVLLGMLTASLACALTETEHTRLYDARNSVLSDNTTERLGRWLAQNLAQGAWLATRDAGVLPYYAGPNIYVAELHQRALTRPHKDGANAAVAQYTPRNPEVIIVTQRRAATTGFVYPNDRQILTRTTEPYQYLGRIYQHFHRYFDVYVRADLNLPPLPADWVVSHSGPRPPLEAR